MKIYRTKKFINKIAVIEEGNIASGPGIVELGNTINEMMWRGAPMEWDYNGFNKPDYQYFYTIVNQFSGGKVPVSTVVQSINRLEKYKATQIPQFNSLKEVVMKDLEVSSEVVEDKKIKFLGKGQYGKLNFFIPPFQKQRVLNNIIKQEMEKRLNEGIGNPKWSQYNNPVFFVFSANKVINTSDMNTYSIDPGFFNIIIPFFQEQGFDVSEMVSGAEIKEEKKEKNKKVNAELKNDILTIGFSEYIGADIRGEIKSSGFYGSKTMDGRFIWINKNPNLGRIMNLIEYVRNLGWDVSELEERLGEIVEEKKEQDFEFNISVRDVTGETGNRWHMGIKFLKSGTWEGETLKDILKFSFGNFSKDLTEEGNRGMYKPEQGAWETFLAGNYEEYQNFISSLKNRGFNYGEVENILKSLVERGLVEKMEGAGELDGFGSKEEFYGELDKYNLPFELYPEQKDAIGRIYSHKSFLRGDQTGVGKTIISILGGDLRSRRSGKRVVVVTKAPIQSQFMDQVVKFLKIDPNDKTTISTNPEDKARWTILSYEYFKSPEIGVGNLNGREQIVNELVKQAQSGEIECLILDECHTVKNGKPYDKELERQLLDSQKGIGRKPSGLIYSTFYMQKFSQDIPFVWGLSATVVANKAIDIYNQLRVINHPLGKISWSKFAMEFGGMHMGRYGMEEGTIDEKLDAVNKLKEYLIDQNAYDALSKKQIREDMPDQVISSGQIEIDEDSLNERIRRRMAGYKSQGELQEMIAYRNEIAIEKAPATVKEALPILEEGKKVMIFSDFRESVEKISAGIQEYFNQRGMGEKVLSIQGGMRQRKRDEAKALFEDMSSNVRCLVLNIVAGGTGLDFPNVTNNIFINDFDWSVANDEQMLGRPYRINTNSDVYVKYILSAPTESDIEIAEEEGKTPRSTDMEFYERIKVKKEIANIIHSLSMEQDAMLKEGKRRGRSKELSEIEKKLNEAKKKMIEMENNDEEFRRKQSLKIKKKTKGKEAKGKNWYKKAKKYLFSGKNKNE